MPPGQEGPDEGAQEEDHGGHIQRAPPAAKSREEGGFEAAELQAGSELEVQGVSAPQGAVAGTQAHQLHKYHPEDELLEAEFGDQAVREVREGAE